GVLAVLAAFGFVLTTALMDLQEAGPAYLGAIGMAKDEAAAWLAEHGVQRAARCLAAVNLGDWLTDVATATLVSAGPDFLSSFIVVLLVVGFTLFEAGSFRSKARWALELGGAKVRGLGRTVGEVQKYLAVKTGISAATG